MLLKIACFSTAIVLTLSACGNSSEKIQGNRCFNTCNFPKDVTSSQCLQSPQVIDYLTNQLLLTQWQDITDTLAHSPVGACYCGLAQVDTTGKIRSVQRFLATSVKLGDAIEAELMAFEPVAIPEAASCIINTPFPISANN